LDEVSGVVFDAGSHSFRVGFAGEEYPKGDIPSYVAVQEVEPDGDVEMKEGAEPDKNIKKKRNIFIGTTKIIVPRAKTTIQNFMKDGMIEDWDMFENLLDYSYNEVLHSEAQYHPALFTESAWNDKAKRERLTELMFEKYNIPAFFLCKNAVLTAFANGRTSGLVVDSGATHTSAVPVYDGYAVTHAVVRSPIGGDVISEQLQYMLEEQNIEVVPTYKIGGKASVTYTALPFQFQIKEWCLSSFFLQEEVNENEAPRWTKKKNLPEVTESYDKFMKKQILEDMAISILQLCDTPLDAEYAEKLPSAPYSFPNGFTKEFLAERIKVPEGLFDLKYLRNIPASQSTLLNVTQIATTAAGMCDIDIRPTLYSGLMVTGGNSLILGFTERLNHDLAHKCPPVSNLFYKYIHSSSFHFLEYYQTSSIGSSHSNGEAIWSLDWWINTRLFGYRCGHFFRRLYVCMSEDDSQDATVKCPEQFIDWAACMQNMSASFHEDGRINEECPCLHSALAHRCGHLMREAIHCYNTSTKSPRGAECEEQFMQQALCVKKYGGEKE
ncbi:Actin, partial [Ancylostoma duodenale]